MKLFDIILLKYLHQWLFDRLCPQCVSVVVRMSSVYCGIMVFRMCDRIDVMDVRIFLHGQIHQAVSCFNLCSFTLVCGSVEIPSFPVYGSLENERLAGMSFYEFLNEWEECGVLQKIYDNYWIYHTERIENAYMDIDSLVQTGKSAW